MTWMTFLLSLFAIGVAGVGCFRWYALERGMIDIPGPRSSHLAPTPRGGGVIFFAAWIILVAVFCYLEMIASHFLWLFAPVLLVGLIGFWSDHKGISVGLRFGLQMLAAAASLFLLLEGGDILHQWLPIPLPLCFLILVIGMVWMTNLFNFMDGADGVAATQAIFVFGLGGYLLFQHQAMEMGTLAWGLAALLAGFLTWNWPTARIFMGDCGSYFLGFLTAVYALASHKHYDMSLNLWIILTSLFWFDATVTLLRRMLAKQDWRSPHRLHAYQRMIQAGWSHQKVLLAMMAINGCLGWLTILAARDPSLEYFALGVSILILTCVYLAVEAKRPMFKTFHKNLSPTAITDND